MLIAAVHPSGSTPSNGLFVIFTPVKETERVAFGRRAAALYRAISSKEFWATVRWRRNGRRSERKPTYFIVAMSRGRVGREPCEDMRE
jgi:hypothetical protein